MPRNSCWPIQIPIGKADAPTMLLEADVSDRESQFNLVEFSVVIVAQSHNPSILNADFLHHNGIVSGKRQPREDCLTSPMLSRVAFDDGLSVQADPLRVTFEQSGDALTKEALVCASAAKGYLKTVPHVRYVAVGVNSMYVLQNIPLRRVSDALRSGGDWMTFDSVVPKCEFKATYEMAGRRATLDVQDASYESEPVTFFRVNIHREIDEPNQQMRLNSMLSALDFWESDLTLSRDLVEHYVSSGGI